MNPHAKALQDLGACGNAVNYAAGYATAQEAWGACERPSWLTWLIARLDQRQGALIFCLCARSAVHLTGEYREEIETLLGRIEAWVWGADVDLEPARSRLWSIYHIIDATSSSAAATDPIDLCNLIRAAVPTCPLAEAVLLELQFPSGTGEWVAEATYPLEEFIAKHRSGMWAAEIAGVRSLAVGESFWGGGGALPEWRVVRKG